MLKSLFSIEYMLSREYIVPIPLEENKVPLDTLISDLKNSEGTDVCLSIDRILCTVEWFDEKQINAVDVALSQHHKSNRESWFYERTFELALKMYGFCSDWKGRIETCRIHEKHKLKIHNVNRKHPDVRLMTGILGICSDFIMSRTIVYNRVNILGCCLLELSKENNNVIYDGSDDIFYLIEYVYRRDTRTLARWARNVRTANDWSLLHLKNYPDFLYTELKYINDPLLVRDIVLQQRSHKLCSFLIMKLLILFSKMDMLNILVESYDEVNASYTIGIFRRLFEEDSREAEKVLKTFIKKTGTRMLSHIFYSCCTIIDSGYVEACLICIGDVRLISDDCLKRLATSYYWPYLVRAHDNFIIFLNLLIDRKLYRKEYCTFEDVTLTSSEGLRRILFIASIEPLWRRGIAKVMAKLIRKYSGGWKEREHGNHENAHVVCLPVDIGNRWIISEEEMAIICDILYMIRDQRISTKTIRKLSLMNPKIFFSKIVDIDEKEYDCFFIKCMNVVLKQLDKEFRWTVCHIMKMVLFKSHEYFDIAIRRALKLKYLWKEIVESCECTDCGVVAEKIPVGMPMPETGKKKGLYSLENSTISCFIQRDQSHDTTDSVNEQVTRENLFLNENKLGYLKFFSDEIKLKYLLERLRKDGQRNYEQLGLILCSLKDSSGVVDGVVFKKNSFILLRPSFKSFSLQILFMQYVEDGEQVLVQLESNEQVIKIGRKNGKLFIKRDSQGEEYILLDEGGILHPAMKFKSSYSASRFSFCTGANHHSLKINSVDRIVVGVNFKGIVNKMIFCEPSVFDKYILNFSHESSFYVDELSRLEKALVHKGCSGVYVDSVVPYFINKRINIEMRGVFSTRRFCWDHNENVVRALRLDKNLLEIMDRV